MKRITAALAVIASLALAGTAQASMVDGDGFTLTATGYDFGNAYWWFGVPEGDGVLEWHHEDGQWHPELNGAIHLNDADGTCGRIRMEYFDSAGSLLYTGYSDAECVTDDSHHAFYVHEYEFKDRRIDEVKVSLQKQTVAGWSTLESMRFDADTHDDDVKITEDGVDFGGEAWGAGAPMGSGEMSWTVSNGDVTPRLRGAIHLNNSSGVCARINLRYLTESGVFLYERAGGSVCAADNGHDDWDVDLAPWSSDKIGQVRVQLQTLAANGNWVVAGSDVVSIAG